jgi:hypothetical protein
MQGGFQVAHSGSQRLFKLRPRSLSCFLPISVLGWMVGVRHIATYCDMLQHGAREDVADRGCFDLSGIAWMCLGMACGCLWV